MRVKAMFFCVGFLLLGLPGAAAQQVPAELIRYPEMIFFNGTVLTVDDQFTVAEAVAVRDGKFLAVGKTDTILRLAGPKTLKVDLERKQTVIPGVINTHSHPDRYAPSHYWSQIPRAQQELIRADVLSGTFQNKDEVLSRIKQIVERSIHPNRQWIRINWPTVRSQDRQPHDVVHDEIFLEEMTKGDLDRVSAGKPLFIQRQIGNPELQRDWALVNSKGLELFLKAYGNLIQPPTESGHLPDPFYEMLYQEVLPRLPEETLAEVFKREALDWYAPAGVTTIFTRLNANHVRGYALLDLRGELPVRMAYAHQIGRSNPFFERDVRRSLGAVQGHGTEKLWIAGISNVQPDRSAGTALCSTFPRKSSPNDPYPEGKCEWDVPGAIGYETAVATTRLGFRLGGTHAAGDKAYEMMLDATLEGAGDVASARKLRTVLEHGQLANPNLIRRVKELDVIWPINPRKILGDSYTVESLYGREVAERMHGPTRTLVEAGATVTWESGGVGVYDDPNSSRYPMAGMERFVTRKNKEGEVRAPSQRVDRKTALQILTRNGARAVLREDELGSIEPGKWADLVVLDNNPLDPSIPDDAISEIQVLMTVLGGEVVYDRATYVLPPADVRRARGEGVPFIDLK